MLLATLRGTRQRLRPGASYVLRAVHLLSESIPGNLQSLAYIPGVTSWYFEDHHLFRDELHLC